MKKSFLYKTGIVLLVVAMTGGCTKKFEDLNTNPVTYSQSNFDPNYLLATSQLTYTGSFDFSFETWRANLIHCSVMMQQFSTVIGYWAGDKYLANTGYTSAYWQVAYPEQVRPVVDLVEITRDKEQYKNLHQIARIMRAMILQRLSDIYGDVPYSEAGLGFHGKIYFPKYDKQQDIYTHIMTEFEDAANKLDPAAEAIAGDAIFGGNITKWKRFGYSLLLRAAMRLSKIDPTAAQAGVQKALNKTMQSNADNAFLVHDANNGRPTVNRNSQVLLGQPERDNVKWSKTLIDLLKNSNDPRLPKIAMSKVVYDGAGNVTSSSTLPADQKGMPNGYDLSGVAGRDISFAPGHTTMADYSKPIHYLTRLGSPTFILTYAETELLLAEAAERWNITGAGTAAEHYNNGVKAAITFMAPYDAAAVISNGDADAFLLANPYVPANGITMINTQYFIHTANMLDFYEGWSNWRRTNIPALTPVNYPNNATNATIPRRFPYPVAEANSNPENYKLASDAVPGGDFLTGRVWWDKP